MKLTDKVSITGRFIREPELQRFPTSTQARAQSVESLGHIDIKDLEYKINKIWSFFPNLDLPYRYGEDFLEFNGAELVLPDDPAVIHQWALRKVQQYYVKLEGKDPAQYDETGLRLRVVAAVRARQADRQFLRAVYDGRMRLTPALVKEHPKQTVIKFSIVRVKI